MTDPVKDWATTTFGLAISDAGGPEQVEDLVIPALRRNPKRAHLLVSTVLGKHVPTAPEVVIGAGTRLARAVACLDPGPVDVIGMAETATALGHCVADELDAAVYLHSTRRPAKGKVYAEFQEAHSHAVEHSIQPSSPGMLQHDRTLVLVDDEISTGDTAMAMIAALHALNPRSRYIVASLVDMRSKDLSSGITPTVDAQIDFVSLALGQVAVARGLADAVCALPPPPLTQGNAILEGSLPKLKLNWPSGVPAGGRHGFSSTDRESFNAALKSVSAQLAAELDAHRPVLVVGHEEFMYLPLRIADNLTNRGFQTKYQSTTRSPAYVKDVPNYPLRRGWIFPASESGESGDRYLYNGWPGAQLLIILDDLAAEGDLRLVNALARDHDVLLAALNTAEPEPLPGESL